MVGVLLHARFYASREEANAWARDPTAKASLKWSGDTDYKLRVLAMVSMTEWTCSVEWKRERGGTPLDIADVPDLPCALLRGGSICEVRFKEWAELDGVGGRVVLGLRRIA